MHPFSPESYPAGKIYKPARTDSIEEVTHFGLESFKMTDQDLATFFGLEPGEDGRGSPLGNTTSGTNIVKKCLWAILATFTFVVFFSSTTAVMSILYPLDAALLSF